MSVEQHRSKRAFLSEEKKRREAYKKKNADKENMNHGENEHVHASGTRSRLCIFKG